MIRRLAPADLGPVRALRRLALVDSPTAFGAAPEEDAAVDDEAWMRRLIAPDAVFGAHREGALVGMAGFLRDRGARSGHRGRLWGVFVSPGHRGAGLARALVTAVIEEAARHVAVLEASVNPANAAARSLYASLGFVEFGLRRRALLVDGVFQDEALIALDLPPIRAERGC